MDDKGIKNGQNLQDFGWNLEDFSPNLKDMV